MEASTKWWSIRVASYLIKQYCCADSWEMCKYDDVTVTVPSVAWKPVKRITLFSQRHNPAALVATHSFVARSVGFLPKKRVPSKVKY
jgi:hypothetical protein